MGEKAWCQTCLCRLGISTEGAAGLGYALESCRCGTRKILPHPPTELDRVCPVCQGPNLSKSSLTCSTACAKRAQRWEHDRTPESGPRVRRTWAEIGAALAAR